MISLDRSGLEGVLSAIEGAVSPLELIKAVQKLRELQTEAAIPALIKVLGYNNPGAAVIAMQGLIDLGQVAVPYLLALLDDYNYGARAYAIRALATIADPRALGCLTECALRDFAPSVRRAAIRGLGNIALGLVPDSEEGQLSQILAVLTAIVEDGDWSMRYGAIVSLGKLVGYGGVRELLQSLVEREHDRVVRARIWLALGM
jgi:phycocyanobilin lyase beta subunit